MNGNIFSKHPDWDYCLEGAKKLVIGTMPPYNVCKNKKNRFNYFYSSKSNYFWHILNFINKDNKTTNIDKKNYNLVNEEECIKLLRDNKIGIIDVVEKCIHNENEKGEPSASDKDLLSIKLKVLMKYIVPVNLLKHY